MAQLVKNARNFQKEERKRINCIFSPNSRNFVKLKQEDPFFHIRGQSITLSGLSIEITITGSSS